MDLSSLTNLLNSLGLSQLGPWGLPVGIGLVVLYVLIRRKLNPPAPSTTPSPVPSPASSPGLLAGVAPLIHDALVALRLIPPTGATIDNVPHATVVQLVSDVQALTDAKTAAHSAALSELSPAPATPPATVPAPALK